MMMRKHINQIHTAVTVRKKRKKRSAEEEAEEKRLIKEAKQNVARHATAWYEDSEALSAAVSVAALVEEHFERDRQRGLAHAQDAVGDAVLAADQQ